MHICRQNKIYICTHIYLKSFLKYSDILESVFQNVSLKHKLIGFKNLKNGTFMKKGILDSNPDMHNIDTDGILIFIQMVY